MTEKLSLNEQIEQILAHEAEKEKQHQWYEKLKRIWQAENRKQTIKTELFELWKGLSKKSIFTLFLIVAFVFMLTLSVL